MKTIARRYAAGVFFTALSIVATACAVVGEKPSETEELTVKLGYEEVSNSYYIALWNASGEFFCLSNDQFDTARGSITLRNSDGSLVPVRSIREPGPPIISRGFNFAEPYLFLQPGEQRKVYIHIDNYVTTPAKYRYEILLSYFRCRDVMDPEGVRRGRALSTHSVHTQGWVDLGLRQPAIGR